MAALLRTLEVRCEAFVIFWSCIYVLRGIGGAEYALHIKLIAMPSFGAVLMPCMA